MIIPSTIGRFAVEHIGNSVTSIAYATFAGNQLTSVTIGSNIDINDHSATMGINTGFKTVYDDGVQLAGTYNYTGGVWSEIASRK